MSSLQTAAPCMQKLDPLKRMNYTFGMLLGVDEFNQEQTYLLAKDRSQYRLAHGYGTICGLQVKIVTAPDLEVQVSQGVAISPRGEEIHVRQLMCARINDWLTNNESVLQEIFGVAPVSLSLCVVLCYRECPTDSVPVPGEPCRTQQDAMSPSHIADSFQMKLCLNSDQISSSPPLSPPLSLSEDICFRPSQTEEDAIDQFGKLLHRITVGPGTSSVTQSQLEEMVRELTAPGADSGIVSPSLTSPPAISTIYLSSADAPVFLRAAFLVWVTEVRPTLMAKAGACACTPPAEQCVLLAELNFSVSSTWQVAGTVSIDESRRPYLLETRVLQEWLLNQVGGGVGGGFGASSVVAAGRFTMLSVTEAVANGPTLNGLTATAGPSPRTFYLDWGGPAAYMSPDASSPPSTAYVVKGTAIGNDPVGLQVMDFAPQGILVQITGTSATGWTVEISEITGG